MTAANAGGSKRPRPIVLVVLDGFGIGHEPAIDAIEAARMPNWRAFLDRWPHSALEASEEFVGLPEGQMGNSEVGHLNLGTGQPVLQDLPRIDKAISTGSFFSRPVLLELCARAKEADHTLHLISLVGPGGVHAEDGQLVAVAELAARQGVGRVRVHGLLDGRDTPPRSAIEFVPEQGDQGGDQQASHDGRVDEDPGGQSGAHGPRLPSAELDRRKPKGFDGGGPPRGPSLDDHCLHRSSRGKRHG